MERADVDTVSDFGPEQITHAGTHFAGSLIRKRHCQNALRHHIMVADEIGDTMGKDTGFATTRTS
jgi:hypothetical protein